MTFPTTLKLKRIHWIALLAMVALWSAPGSARQTAALKDLVPKGMLIGAALNPAEFDGQDPVADPIILAQFNVISPENVLKFQSTEPRPGEFNFDPADRYVAFGEAHGMAVIGHNLVWHSQTPAWVFQGPDGAPADRATLLERMHSHIAAVAGRYKGRIHGWDVVNEALNEDGTMRQSPWFKGIGDDYIEKAFQFAHEADPNAELYYNEYNMWKPEKRAGAIRIVKDLQAHGLRIDGVGIQAHWQIDSPSIEQIDQAISDVAAAGVHVMITELDINMLPQGPNVGRRGQPPPPNPYPDGLPAEEQQRLAKRYADIFRVFMKHKDQITRINFWGVDDAHSWLNRPGRPNYPLLWDGEGQPKPAFQAVVDVLKGQ